MENQSIMETKTHSHHQTQTIELKPKLGGFLFSYILFSLPGFIAATIWLVISTIVLFSVGAAVLFSGNPESVSQPLDYEIVRKGEATKTVLIYDISGPITSSNSAGLTSSTRDQVITSLVEKDFRKIKEDKNIKNVVFRVNTPGGEAGASKVLGDMIGDLKNHFNQKEIVFYFDSLAASGGLLAAYKNPNYVVGSPYGETGSIGVILTLPNFSETAEKIGYKETVIKSSESKDIGNPLREPTTKEIGYFQSQVDKEFKSFKEIVATGRNLDAKKVDEFANGYTYFNDEARNLGLIDRVGGLDIATTKAAENAGISSDYQVVEVKQNNPLFGGLFAQTYLSDIFSISKAASKVADRTTFFKSGTMYMVDEYKL
jgi:protease-4